MKHSIRIGGEVRQIDCELGSGFFDKNGVEIYEGDAVKLEMPSGKKIACAVVRGDCNFRLKTLKQNKPITTLPCPPARLEVMEAVT